ncbi:hypothetical protein FHR34_006891 [Kitasatospora kifunensis]|uniref:Uncharacterized protein n=1 Tax=Kitasatospora kifunensis TaxID=58351 RepID=A0A7W7VYR7_KITKI|nr:hypothetical protein [Kitasatospora kifunensis]
MPATDTRWVYDGPNHCVRTEIIDSYGGQLSWGIYN